MEETLNKIKAQLKEYTDIKYVRVILGLITIIIIGLLAYGLVYKLIF